MIIDKLYESVSKKGHVCVGLDTDIEYLPKSFADSYDFEEDALFRFNQRIIDATMDVAACFKVQIAYYEAYGLKGLRAYQKTLQYIRNKGGIVIADIKRGDIAKTAEMYAKAHLKGEFESDFVTLSPYMGMDSLQPYLPYVKNDSKGIFALVRTSNQGAKDIEYIEDSSGKKVYDVVGEKIQDLGNDYRGKCGYSSVGAVVGCTHVEEGVKLRKQLGNTFFLIPGYGAQGGRAQDVALYLKGGNGGVVNSSRAILLAYKGKSNGEKNFDEYAREETIKMRDEIFSAIQ